jgi:L-alanine-DL-glutamate epimerase-like enolase superfamily enzyme
VETDLTIGMGSASVMAATALEFKRNGVRIIKIKLGKNGEADIERVKQIRLAVGEDIILRVDANQGWDYETAVFVLNQISTYNIEFCEQPMRHWNDYKLPALIKLSPVKIMADESVFDHHDAERLIAAGACDYINIKFAKSGGILEATKIATVCKQHNIPCMLGGMLESRIALSAFTHFIFAHDNIVFYDMDTCMVGHKEDPVKGGLRYNGYHLEIDDTPGIGADATEEFLKRLEKITI